LDFEESALAVIFYSASVSIAATKLSCTKT